MIFRLQFISIRSIHMKKRPEPQNPMILNLGFGSFPLQYASVLLLVGIPLIRVFYFQDLLLNHKEGHMKRNRSMEGFSLRNNVMAYRTTGLSHRLHEFS